MFIHPLHFRKLIIETTTTINLNAFLCEEKGWMAYLHSLAFKSIIHTANSKISIADVTLKLECFAHLEE